MPCSQHTIRILTALLVLSVLWVPARADEEPASLPEAVVKARALIDEARTLRGAQGGWPEARAKYEAAIRLLESEDGHKEELAAALTELGSGFFHARQPKAALDLSLRAVKLYRAMYEGDHLRLAMALENLGAVHSSIGQFDQALAVRSEALAMRTRLVKGDDALLAKAHSDLGGVYYQQGRADAAVKHFVAALEMGRRLFGDVHGEVVASHSNLAAAYTLAARPQKALPHNLEAVAIARKVYTTDHVHLAASLLTLSSTYKELGQAAEALPLQQEAAGMFRRLFRGDHPYLVSALNNMGGTLGELGRSDEALPVHLEALQMLRRLVRGDHHQLVLIMNNVAYAYDHVGRPADAQPLQEAALAMARRVFKRDHPTIATTLNNMGTLYEQVGRFEEALAMYAEAVAVGRRLYPDGQADLAASMLNVGALHMHLDRPDEALPHVEAGAQMMRKLFEGDHPDVASGLRLLGDAHFELAHADEALKAHEEAVAMLRRLGRTEHPDLALALHELSRTYHALGRLDEEVELLRESVAIGRTTAWRMTYVGEARLARLFLYKGKPAEALEFLRPAVEFVETQRTHAAALGPESRAASQAGLRRRADPLALLVRAQVTLGRPEAALDALERSRGREVLDLLERGRQNLWQRAADRARATNDEELLGRIEASRKALVEQETRLIQATRARAQAWKNRRLKEASQARAAEIEARKALQMVLRDRLLVVRDALPEVRPSSVAELQALLAKGERMLAYSFGRDASFVFVVRPEDQGVEAHALTDDRGPLTAARVGKAVGAYWGLLAEAGGVDRHVKANGVHPGELLFRALLPPKVWVEVHSAERVYVLPHGAAHKLPFEALVSARDAAGKPRYVVQDAPPIAYATSGSVVRWLRARGSEPSGADLVALGDPSFGRPPDWPEKGVLVRSVTPSGQAARAGVRVGDVIVSYAGQPVADLDGLRTATGAVDPNAGTVAVQIDREGRPLTVELAPGRLGVELMDEPPGVAGPKLLAALDRDAPGRTRAGRSHALRRLPGTRKELQDIRAAVLAHGGGRKTVLLLGADATEQQLFDASRSARILHLATHGLVDETVRASFSALALTPPRMPVPGNDGFLTLADLLERWQGQLAGTQLVVLSACDSQSGKVQKDEGPFALTWGFCYAGARAAIGSLWKVDDQSTAALMKEFYGQLFGAQPLPSCDALHAARRAMAKRYADPHHWAAFVFVGAP